MTSFRAFAAVLSPFSIRVLEFFFLDKSFGVSLTFKKLSCGLSLTFQRSQRSQTAPLRKCGNQATQTKTSKREVEKGLTFTAKRFELGKRKLSRVLGDSKFLKVSFLPRVSVRKLVTFERSRILLLTKSRLNICYSTVVGLIQDTGKMQLGRSQGSQH